MNDDPRAPELHPDAELASYVDGSATEEERRHVETHLDGCASCRADLEFAMRAHAAMDALPQVEAPGLAKETLGWLSPQDGEAVLERGVGSRGPIRRSPWRAPGWQRVAWGAGLAAAAAVAAVFFFSSLQGGSTHNAARPLPAAAPGAGTGAREAYAVRSQTNYNRASVDALARQLAQTGGVAEKSGTTTGTAAAPLASPQFSDAKSARQALDRVATTTAVGCLQRGAGLGSDVDASYVEVASFDGKPAFIGAFPNSPSGGGIATQLVVIAVDQLSCQALYLVTLPL